MQTVQADNSRSTWQCLLEVSKELPATQSTYCYICFSGEMQDHAWTLSAGLLPELLPHSFISNAMEADMRIWRHATQSSQHQNVLIYCPDTDVYNIGLALAKPTQKYIVQINLPHDEPRYIDVHKLLSAFKHWPLLIRAIWEAQCYNSTYQLGAITPRILQGWGKQLS